MANEGSWAVVLPDQTARNTSMMQMLWQHNMQQQRLAAMQQQRELARQAKAAQFVGQNFKDANYATGTAADPIINKMTSDAREKFARLIHENPNMDEGDLELQMQGDLSKISQYSAAIKAGRKNIEDSLQHYQQLPGIDVGNLKNAAINRMLYQGGKSVVDDPTKIDLGRNYLDEELGTNPDHYVIGDVPLTKAIEAYKPKKGGDTTINEHAGVTTEKKFTDEYYPWQSEVKDAKGNVTGLQVNYEPASLNGQPIIDPETRQPMKVVTDQTLKQLSGTGVAANIKRDTDAFIKDHGYDPAQFPAGSQAYQSLAKHVLYNKLSELTPSEFRKEAKKTNATFVDKMQAGLVDALGRTLNKSQKEKEEKLLNGNFAKIRRAVNMEPEALAGGVPYRDPTTGKQFIDVTSFVGGFKTDADKKATQYDPGYKQVQHLLIDPTTPGKLYTIEGTDGHLQEYDPESIDALQLRYGTSNGHDNLADVKKVIQKIPIKQNVQAARQLRADMELQRRQQQQKAQESILNFNQ